MSRVKQQINTPHSHVSLQGPVSALLSLNNPINPINLVHLLILPLVNLPWTSNSIQILLVLHPRFDAAIYPHFETLPNFIPDPYVDPVPRFLDCTLYSLLFGPSLFGAYLWKVRC